MTPVERVIAAAETYASALRDYARKNAGAAGLLHMEAQRIEDAIKDLRKEKA